MLALTITSLGYFKELQSLLLQTKVKSVREHDKKNNSKCLSWSFEFEMQRGSLETHEEYTRPALPVTRMSVFGLVVLPQWNRAARLSWST